MSDRSCGSRNFLRSLQRVAALLALVAPALSLAVEAPLTLAEAQRRALELSPLLAAQASVATAARDMAVAAAELPDPVLKLGVDNLPVDGPDAWSFTRDFMTMRRIGLMQEWTRSDKRDARRARFEREEDKAKSEQAAARATVRREVTLAWIDRYYAEALLAVAVDEVAQARREIEAAEAAFRGGRGTAAELLAARGAAAALDSRVSEARRRVAVATVTLERWVGPAASAPLTGEPPYETLDVDVRELVAHLDQAPAIGALSLQAEVAAAEARLARANRDPDWTVEVAYQQRGSAYSNMMSIGVSVPLPWNRAQRQDRELAARIARVDEARAQRADALRAFRGQAQTWAVEWENGRERIALHEEKLLPLARQATAAAIAAYRGGKGTLAEVLAARRTELDHRREQLAVEQETARAWAQLNFLGIDRDAIAMGAAGRHRTPQTTGVPASALPEPARGEEAR